MGAHDEMRRKEQDTRDDKAARQVSRLQVDDVEVR